MQREGGNDCGSSYLNVRGGGQGARCATTAERTTHNHVETRTDNWKNTHMHAYTHTHKHTNTHAQTQTIIHKHIGTQHAVTHTHAFKHAHTGTHTHGAGGGEGSRKLAELSTCLRVCVCHVYLCVYVNCILGVCTSAYVHVSFFVSFYVYMRIYVVFNSLRELALSRQQ